MKYLSILLTLALGLFLSSCTKDKAADQIASTEVVKNYLRTASSFDNAYYNVQRTAQLEENIASFTSNKPLDVNCIEVAFEPHVEDFFPAHLGLNFGENCLQDGHALGGKLNATFLNFLSEENSRYFIEFDAFSVDGFSLGGVYEWKNLGSDDVNQLAESQHIISNAAIAGPGDWTSTYDAVANAVQIEGNETFLWSHGKSGWSDNVWEETSTGSFTNTNGDLFQFTTISALRKAANCNFPTAGLIELNSTSLEHPIQVDFGDGSCDDIVSITVGKQNFEVSL